MEAEYRLERQGVGGQVDPGNEQHGEPSRGTPDAGMETQ